MEVNQPSPVDVVAHAWYEPGKEHQGLPVGSIFTGDATDIAVGATVTLGNRNIHTEHQLCCQGHSLLPPAHPAADRTTSTELVTPVRG